VGARRDIGLDADDRLDAGVLGLLPELVGAEKVAVVGRRDAGIPISAGRVERSSIRAAPSSMEYSVWTCRCTKFSEAGMGWTSPAILGRPPTAPRVSPRCDGWGD
jgi:hypothetical protein